MKLQHGHFFTLNTYLMSFPKVLSQCISLSQCQIPFMQSSIVHVPQIGILTKVWGFFLRFYLFTFREKKGGGEGQGEKRPSVASHMCPD